MFLLKRIFVFALASAFLSLAACGDDDSSFATRPSGDSSSSVCEDCDNGYSSSKKQEDGESLSSSSGQAPSAMTSSSAKSSSSVALATPCKTETEDNCEYGELVDDRDGQTYKTVNTKGEIVIATTIPQSTAKNMAVYTPG